MREGWLYWTTFVICKQILLQNFRGLPTYNLIYIEVKLLCGSLLKFVI